jgi:hypothetical protein
VQDLKLGFQLWPVSTIKKKSILASDGSRDVFDGTGIRKGIVLKSVFLNSFYGFM